VLAAGSLGAKPDIPGLAKYGFTVDQLDDAIALDHHLHALANRPSSAARDTAVVCGGGFTGIEVATELPSRLPDYELLELVLFNAIPRRDTKPVAILGAQRHGVSGVLKRAKIFPTRFPTQSVVDAGHSDARRGTLRTN
jgi:hypothetical protein